MVISSLVVETCPKKPKRWRASFRAGRAWRSRGERMQARGHHRGRDGGRFARHRERIHRRPGVTGINLVYANFEDGPHLAEGRRAMSEQAAARKRARWTGARHVVQVAVLALFMLPLLATAGGCSADFRAGRSRRPPSGAAVFRDPFLLGPSSAQKRSTRLRHCRRRWRPRRCRLRWLAAALPVLAVYGLVRGRAFCGWACPVNLMLSWWTPCGANSASRCAKRPWPRRAKIGVAAAELVLSAITSIPVFEAFSPISAVNKGILLGSAAGLWTLAAIVAAELFWGHRVWCRALCPLGGFYEALGRAGQVQRAHRPRRMREVRRLQSRVPVRSGHLGACHRKVRRHRARGRLHGVRRVRRRVPDACALDASWQAAEAGVRRAALASAGRTGARADMPPASAARLQAGTFRRPLPHTPSSLWRNA